MSASSALQPAYVMGMAYERPEEVVTDVMANRWVMFKGKPVHPHTMLGWSINRVSGEVRNRALRRADHNPASPFEPFPMDEMF